MKRTILVLALVFSVFLCSCFQPTKPEPAVDGPSETIRSPAVRELGTLTAIYPIPLPDGSFDLELRMTLDTVWVDLEALQAFASDSAGKALIRSTVEAFYTMDEKCFFNPKKEACLYFRQASPGL